MWQLWAEPAITGLISVERWRRSADCRFRWQLGVAVKYLTMKVYKRKLTWVTINISGEKWGNYMSANALATYFVRQRASTCILTKRVYAFCLHTKPDQVETEAPSVSRHVTHHWWKRKLSRRNLCAHAFPVPCRAANLLARDRNVSLWKNISVISFCFAFSRTYTFQLIMNHTLRKNTSFSRCHIKISLGIDPAPGIPLMVTCSCYHSFS